MVLLARSVGTAQVFLAQIAEELPAALWRHAVVLGIVLVYWIAGLIISQLAGIPATATVTTYLPTFTATVPLIILVLIGARGLQIIIVERPRRPLSQLISEIRARLATPERLAHALPLLVGMLVFGGTFTVVKTSIPSLTTYTWDASFEAWDRWLHGGLAPWQLVQPIIGFPIVTAAIDWIYNSWFSVLSLVWVWQAFSQRDNRLRLQFFLTLILAWIVLGNVGAILFASAGPCYFNDVTGLPDPFLPLMNYLGEANRFYPIWALTAQDALWNSFALRTYVLGAGISAMPSMHVAIATLFVLLCWRTARWAGIVMTVYAILIMIGSVHLGWHYAIDGYVGAFGIIAIWWIVGRALALRVERNPSLPITGQT